MDGCGKRVCALGFGWIETNSLWPRCFNMLVAVTLSRVPWASCPGFESQIESTLATLARCGRRSASLSGELNIPFQSRP